MNTELPKLKDGWKWVKLGEVCETIMGQSPPGSTYNRENIGLPFYQGKIDFGDIYPTANTWCSEPIKIAQPNDILISVRAPVGPTNIANQKCCIGRGLSAIRVGENVNMWFLFYHFRSIEKELSDKYGGRGSTFGAMNREHLHDILLPLPPLPEQKRIAGKIQEMMQEVESARTACEKQLEEAKALPSAYLREVFQSEEAKKWERKKLDEVCKVFSGSSAPQDEKYFKNGKYPFVRVQDLGRYGKTTNLTDIKDYVNDLAVQELNLIKAEIGTILFPKSGAAITTNNRAILGVDAYIVSHLAAVKPNDDITSTHFIYYWLCQTDMVNYMENPGYPSLKLSTIAKIKMPLPDLEKQNRLIIGLNNRIEDAEKMRISIEKKLDTINAIPQAILKKAFKGEL
jgi:type I restriction enzyme S subunit